MKKIPNVPQVGGYNFPSSPRPQVAQLLDMLSDHSTILDIGAGFGNNAELLLRAGHHVVATETLPEAIKHLDLLTLKYLELEVVQEDVRGFNAGRSYDAIICAMVLHFLTKTETMMALESIQTATKIGGYNVIINHLADSRLSHEYKHPFEAGELKNYYSSSDWEIVFYEEAYPQNPLSKTPFMSARIIARRIEQS